MKLHLQLLPLALLPLTLLAQPNRRPPRPTQPDPIAQYDAYVQQAIRDWKVPGLTVTIVKDGKVLFKKGYGVLEQNKPQPVNTQTLFAIASTTKAMTAACIGMLVDEGKLKWDDLVIDHLPDFQLYDPFVTRDIRIRDLLTHNTGVGNADILWAVNSISQDEILRRMRYVKPSYPLRGGFMYQNVMYVAAGKVIEKVSGKPWAAFIKERIFEPLGMSRTRALFSQVTDLNRAKPHIDVNNDSLRLVPSRQEESLGETAGAAGSVWSCPDDLAAWMQCMLDSARYNGKTILKPTTWAELFKPQAIIPDSQFYPTQQLTRPVWKTYGLGWFQHDYRGHRINFHTGSLMGMIAIHGQLPDHKLAVFVQANLDHAELRHALMYRAFDQFALGIDRDWNTEFLKLYGNLKQQGWTAERKTDSTRVRNTKPSLPLTAYVGTYTHPLAGKVTVTTENSTLHLSINSILNATLNHWHFDTFQAVYDDAWNGKTRIRFGLDAAGKVGSLHWEGMEFTFVPEPAPIGKGSK